MAGALTGPKGSWPNDAKTGPKGKPMTPVPSASLIVLCPISSSSKGQEQDYATLTVQRSARDGSSFRSAIVFPGGVLDLADEDAIKRQAANSLSPCTNTGDKSEEEAVYWQSLRLCALRETFEETGLVLLAAGDASSQQGLPRSRAVGPTEAGIDKQEWARIREEVHNDARAFTPFLARISASIFGGGEENDVDTPQLPPLAPMYHHSNWVTPRSIIRPAKRFDAHFFLTVLDKPDVLGPLTSKPQSTDENKPASNLLNLSADGTETLSLRLATPQELVNLACQDKVVMFPPQFYILSDLAASLRSSDPLASVRPLIFRRPEQSTPNPSSSSASSKAAATTMEEEPRGLDGRNYTWDRLPSNRPALSWVSDKLPPLASNSSTSDDDNNNNKEGRLSVTSVMPRALPGSGTNVDLTTFSGGSGDGTSSPAKAEAEEGEASFVFPLVLPGDFLASKLQKRALWPPFSSTPSTASSPSLSNEGVPLNRVYVSPRSKADGGGLVIIGSVRRGQAGLIDFEEGKSLDVIGNIEELEEEDDEGEEEEQKGRGIDGSARARL